MLAIDPSACGLAMGRQATITTPISSQAGHGRQASAHIVQMY